MAEVKLSEAQWHTLRELSSWGEPYPYRVSSCRALAAKGLAEEVPSTWARKPYRITPAGRALLDKAERG